MSYLFTHVKSELLDISKKLPIWCFKQDICNSLSRFFVLFFVFLSRLWSLTWGLNSLHLFFCIIILFLRSYWHLRLWYRTHHCSYYFLNYYMSSHVIFIFKWLFLHYSYIIVNSHSIILWSPFYKSENVYSEEWFF